MNPFSLGLIDRTSLTTSARSLVLDRVGAAAEVDEGAADQVGDLAQQRDVPAHGRRAARTPPTRSRPRRPALRPVEADPGGAPLPGDGVAVARVVVGVDELPVEVGQVGDEVLAQRLDQVELQVGGDEVVGRDDDVVAGGAGPHLGQQVLVGGVDVVVDPEVGLGLEQRDGAVVDVVRPVVDVEQPLVDAVAGDRLAVGGRGGAPAGRRRPTRPPCRRRTRPPRPRPAARPPAGSSRRPTRGSGRPTSRFSSGSSLPARTILSSPCSYPRRTTTSSTSSASPAGTPSATISSRSGPALADGVVDDDPPPRQAGQRRRGRLGDLLAAGADQPDGDLLAGGARTHPGRGHIALALPGRGDDLGQGQADPARLRARGPAPRRTTPRSGPAAPGWRRPRRAPASRSGPARSSS